MLTTISKNQKGFTLIELMVVVAIIGVLVTLGVPTFKKMIQKAKKTEAKTALAALFTAETAFFGEYNTYGNNIDKMGFELEGDLGRRTYDVGFPQANCADQTQLEPSDPAVKARLLTSLPDYYAVGSQTVISRGTSTDCFAGSVAVTGKTFLASASGLISPDAAAVIDVWTMNEGKILANSQDGMK